MKKKLYITRTVKVIAFGLAVILTTYLLQSFLLKRIDNNTMRMEAFFLEEKGSLDVVVVGASDVYAGYSAAYAYEHYGFTSYPFATQNAPANIVLPQIKEVIKYHDPKMIVVEINAFLYKDSELPAESSHRMFLDNVPDDEIKRAYISETFSEDKQIEYYLPIIKYHGSWGDYPWKIKYLVAELRLRHRGYALFRGFKTVANEFHPPGKVYNDKLADDDSTKPLGVNGQRYLIRTLEYLKANNIKNVVFVRFPHIVRSDSYSRFQRCNEADRIITSYGYDFINLERYSVENGFDVNKDFYNWDHLNIYGCEKLTELLCDKLVNEYGVTCADLSEAQKASWQQTVDYYHMIHDCSADMINSRKKVGKTGEGGTSLSEDTKTIEKITKFAEKKNSQKK